LVGSTPLPLPLANAALQSLELLSKDQSYKSRLLDNIDYVRRALAGAGFLFPEPVSPIFAFYPRRAAEIAKLKAAMVEGGIFPPFIRYPGAPESGYFRFVISSEHRRDQVEALVEVLKHQDCLGPARWQRRPLRTR
jgi:7-keto-8-aminopelargonate synthetase-like enzyme